VSYSVVGGGGAYVISWYDQLPSFRYPDTAHQWPSQIYHVQTNIWPNWRWQIPRLYLAPTTSVDGNAPSTEGDERIEEVVSILAVADDDISEEERDSEEEKGGRKGSGEGGG
jgi:hypothetical protein